jgi:branched-chain amino acid transport system substrate-binding protein
MNRRDALRALGALPFGGIASRAAAAPARPILIALDLEFGHATSTSDDAIKMGVLTAIDEVNAAGGVLGRRLATVETDNRSVPARGRDNFREHAANADVVAAFCGKFSPVALEQSPLATELRLPLLDPWAAADAIVPDKPQGSYVFRLSLRDEWAVPAMFQHFGKRGITRVAVMYPTSAWGRSNDARVKEHAARNPGIQIATEHWYNWGAKSLAGEYGAARAAGARGLLFVGNEGEGSVLAREVAALPAAERLPIVSHWGVTGGNFLELTGKALQEVDFSVVQTFTLEGRKDAKAAAVVARAGRLFGVKSARDIPSHAGFGHAYDLAHILARAIALAGSADRPAVRDALERVRDYAGLVDQFPRPFSESRHEALSPRNVFIGRFTAHGTLERT